MKTALITGATSGIGLALAKELIKDHQLIITGRREDRLNQIQEELSKINPVDVFCFDVSNRKEVESVFKSLKENNQAIDIVINNAGNAHGLATFDEGEMDDYEAMIDINLKGLIYVSKNAIPFLEKSESAQIVNISSIAGKETYLRGNVYCASKSGVEALSEGMRIDLAPKGIKVTNIAPGAVETEFSEVRFKGDSEKAKNVYKGFDALQAEDIANAVAYCLRAPKHVHVADMTILAGTQYSATGIIKE